MAAAAAAAVLPIAPAIVVLELAAVFPIAPEIGNTATSCVGIGQAAADFVPAGSAFEDTEPAVAATVAVVALAVAVVVD